MKYKNLLNKFNNWLDTQTYSINTKNTYIKIIKNFLSYMKNFKQNNINNINYEIFIQFIQTRKNFTYSFSSQKIRLSTLKLFFLWCSINKYTYNNPINEYKKYQLNIPSILEKKAKIETEIIVLSNKEKLQLLNRKLDSNFINIRNKCIINLLLNTAMYSHELINLTIEDINLKNNFLIVKSTNKERQIKLSHDLCKSFHMWLHERKKFVNNKQINTLFLTNKIKKISKRTLHRIISKCLLNSGIKKPHIGAEILRHTAIHNMLSMNKTVETIQSITGMKTLKNIQKYSKVKYN